MLFLRSGTKLEEQLEFSLELADVDVSLGLLFLEGTEPDRDRVSTSIAPTKYNHTIIKEMLSGCY